MVIEKEWLTLSELSNRWQCSVDELMHVAVTGRLALSFDWVLIHDEIRLSNLPLCLILAPEKTCINVKQLRFIGWLNAGESSDLQARLFPLSASEISVINKNGFILVKKHYDPITDLLLKVAPKDGAEYIEYPKLTLDQIVIPMSVVISYENKNSCSIDKPEHSKNNDELQTKERSNLYKTIGLLAKALLDSGIKNLKTDEKANITAIARKIERYIPSDPMGQKECHGLSERSLRARLTKGLESLDS